MHSHRHEQACAHMHTNTHTHTSLHSIRISRLRERWHWRQIGHIYHQVSLQGCENRLGQERVVGWGHKVEMKVFQLEKVLTSLESDISFSGKLSSDQPAAPCDPA